MSNWVMKLLLALCAGCYAGAFVCLLERFEKSCARRGSGYLQVRRWR